LCQGTLTQRATALTPFNSRVAETPRDELVSRYAE
jgi:hypothetical protein